MGVDWSTERRFSTASWKSAVTCEASPPWQAVPEDGWLVPTDAPGFGIDVDEASIRPFEF